MTAERQSRRSGRAFVAEETIRILEAGGYTFAGEPIDIAAALRRATQNTASYPPETDPVVPEAKGFDTQIEVVNETSFAGARRIVEAGGTACVLNFASAIEPGGGFINGAQAQEECLARASGLYPCIKDDPMYPFHRKRRDALYTHYVLYAPEVPVFRDDDDNLIAPPYTTGIVTAAAVNQSQLGWEDAAEENVDRIMSERIDKVLAVMRFHGHEEVVLGAWGCGVFGNDPTVIAELFRSALEGPHKGAFSRVIFSVLDHRNNTPLFSAFTKVLAPIKA